MGAPREVIPDGKDIVLFDGVCNLCSASVQYIIKRDPRAKFQFASLQSPTGQELLKRYRLDQSVFHSIILIRGTKAIQQSDAALEIARSLTGGWPLFFGFKILPRFIRDAVYHWISKNRYRFFGKKDACWLPSAELKSRFID